MCTPFWGSIQSLISLVLSCPLLMTAWEKKKPFSYAKCSMPVPLAILRLSVLQSHNV